MTTAVSRLPARPAWPSSLVAAILVPSLPLSIAFFGLAGVASGPIFPMIIAIGGERYRDRSTAVSGFLGGTGVIGSIVYPSIMGFMSVTVGLTVAMLGNAVLAVACVVALVLVGRSTASADRLVNTPLES